MNKLIPLWMTTLLLFGSPALVQNTYSTGSLAQRCEGCGLPTLLQSQVAGPLACRYGMSHVLIFSVLTIVIITLAISLIPVIRGLGEGQPAESSE